MNWPASTATQPRSTPGPCRCGCADCDKTCCQLDCLVQPRFFCGQLLTDRDLTALVDWTRGKFSLTRYREGWGVVCGLGLRCDPDKPGGVIIEPGYAISCCGDDILVCEPTQLDLSTACHIQDECLDRWGKLTTPATAMQPAWQKIGSLSSMLGEVVAVDVLLAYQEKPTDPQTSLGYGGCSGVSDCEYSRVHEGFTLTYTPAPAKGDTGPASAAPGSIVITEILDWQKRTRPKSDAIRRKLQDSLASNPLQSFCFVSDLVRDTRTVLSEANLPAILFWMLLDYRTQALACACGSCDAEAGVPLGRVWLRAVEVERRRECHVVAISATPSRRALRRDCAPTDGAGCVELREVMWQTPDDAQARLAAYGIRVVNEWEFTANTLDDVRRLAGCYSSSICKSDSAEVDLLWFVDPLTGDRRVVAVCPPGAGGGTYS